MLQIEERINSIIFNLPLDILNCITDPIHIISKDYEIVWTNLWQKLGRQNFNVLGKNCFNVYQRKRRRCTLCPVEKVLHSGLSCKIEKNIFLLNGSQSRREIKCYPLLNDRQEIVAAIKIGFAVPDNKKEQQLFDASILEKISEKSSILPKKKKVDPTKKINLSRRETDILRLVSKGLTNREIAEALFISHHTVKTHIIHIFKKLSVNDRVQAAVLAARLDLL